VVTEMKKRSARGRITRESVTDAALAIADRDGFDGVTIRAVAAGVGATPMALYTYFPDKDALYEGMRGRLFERVSAANISRRTWQSVLEGVARSVHRVMGEHPHWTPLLAHDSGLPSSGLAFIDGLWELMLKEGFAIEDVLRAYGSVMSFAIGSVLFERIMMGAEGDVIAKRLALMKELVGHAPARYVSLATVAAKVDRWRWDDVFELGIRSLLAGIETQCAPPARHARRRPRARRA
jgi:AcrR family transcriptional regulator